MNYTPGLWAVLTSQEKLGVQDLKLNLPRRALCPNLFFNFHFKLGDASLMFLDAKGTGRIEAGLQVFFTGLGLFVLDPKSSSFAWARKNGLVPSLHEHPMSMTEASFEVLHQLKKYFL